MAAEPDALTSAYCFGYDEALRYVADLLEDQGLFDLADQLREQAEAAWEEMPHE